MTEKYILFLFSNNTYCIRFFAVYVVILWIILSYSNNRNGEINGKQRIQTIYPHRKNNA